MIRKNKKLNKKIDIESRRQKKFGKEIHELNLRRKQLSIQENIKRKELIIRLNENKSKLKKLKEEANEKNKVLKDLIKKLNDPNKRYCEKCDIIIHRASFAKHLRSKKHLNLQPNIVDTLIQPTTSAINPKTLQELARDKIKLTNRELNKLLAEKMINPYYFKDQSFYDFLKINLDSHHINHLNSKITISSTAQPPHNYIDKLVIDRLVREMATIYAKLISQFKFKYQCTFLARFDKQNEDGELLKEKELFINLRINHKLTDSDLKKINVQWDLDRQIQQQELKDSGWNFDKIISLTIYFYKTQELNGTSYVNIPIRSNAILNIQNDDKYCFIWSILAHMFPCYRNGQRVSNYKYYFDELNIEGFDFTDGFIVSDVKKFEKLNNLSINIFELRFYQDLHDRENYRNTGGFWKHKLIPLEISNQSNEIEIDAQSVIDPNRRIDLLIYKGHHALIRKLHVFLGKPKCRFVCRRCLGSYSNKDVLEKHKFKCEKQEITSIRTSNESHI